jgi:hypothetical protein
MVSEISIAAYLKAAPAPVSLKKLPATLAGQLSEAIERNEAFAWPKYRGAARYWHSDAAAVVREALAAIAAEAARPKAALIAETARRAHGCGKKMAEEQLKALVKAGEIKSAKIVGQTNLFYAAAHPEALVVPSMAALRQRFRQLNIKEDAPVETRSSRDVGAEVLDAVRRLEPAPGVPVTVQSLRAAVKGAGKADFDAAVLALADAQKVYLTTHDHGWALPESERDQLVWDGGQKLYVAVAIRD